MGTSGDGEVVANPYWLQALENDAEEAARLLMASALEGSDGVALRSAAALFARGAGERVAGRDADRWEQGAVMCRVLLAGESQDWAGVLAIAPPSASGGDQMGAARSRYRALARTVHPDKCAWPRAAEAFRLLGVAAEAVCEPRAAAPGKRKGSCEEEDWDENEEWMGTRARGTDAGDSPEEVAFRGMPFEELRVMVGQMQRGVMNAMRANNGVEFIQLQARLRVARAVLSERTPPPTAAFTDSGGFFL